MSILFDYAISQRKSRQNRSSHFGDNLKETGTKILKIVFFMSTVYFHMHLLKSCIDTDLDITNIHVNFIHLYMFGHRL